jgi:hypothetical protein
MSQYWICTNNVPPEAMASCEAPAACKGFWFVDAIDAGARGPRKQSPVGGQSPGAQPNADVPSAQHPAAPAPRPAPRKVPEPKGNLRRRGQWFGKRSGGGEAN